MPRICTSANDPLDFCAECMPTWNEAEKRYGDVGGGPDGRGNCFGYEEDHPPYEDENYKCEKCRHPLTADDN